MPGPVDQLLPQSDSSFCIASDTAGWVRSSFSAAREKLFSVATVRKTFNGYSSINAAYGIIVTYSNRTSL